MENDSIRASGTNTVVDIWIDGKLRAICVSREAISAFLGFEQAAGMSDDDRCEFVRTHLPLVVTASKTRLLDTNPGAATVIIDVDQLPRSDGRAGDRRKDERRKEDRRKTDRPMGDPPRQDRRHGDRRTGQRRRSPKSQ